MIISIHQPDYVPYLGYFYKIFQSEIFVFLDDAQFSNDNMHHWNKIKISQGECRLKIPVEYKFGEKINNVRTRDELKWKDRHLKTIEINYKKAPYFNEIFKSYRNVLLNQYLNLAELNIAIITFFCESLGFRARFVNSSELSINSVKEERIIKICLALGGTEYLSGVGAKIYQIEHNFTDLGLKLIYSNYQTFNYPQLWGEFIPNLSILDYLFNCGFNNPFKIEK